METCLKHNIKTREVWVDKSPFPKDTKILLEYCTKCRWKRAWAYPPTGMTEINSEWASKTFFSEPEIEIKVEGWGYEEANKMGNRWANRILLGIFFICLILIILFVIGIRYDACMEVFNNSVYCMFR
jgi:hypothetical protein